MNDIEKCWEEFLKWFKGRFGYGFGGISDEECNLEVCWKSAWKARAELEDV